MALFSKAKLDALKKRTLIQLPRENIRTVLIVDDEPANLAMLNRILSNRYQVIEAISGEHALQQIRDLPDKANLSLIISDQRMPGMSGVDFLRQAKVLVPDALRIVLTAYMDVDAILASVNELQIYHFIVKPFDRQEFLLTVQRANEYFDLNASLNDYIQNLEQKVAERTQALELKNRELQDAYLRLEQQSITDPLTGLKNRCFLNAVLSEDSAYVNRSHGADLTASLPQHPALSADEHGARDLVFYLIDLDHFKQVNDTYGHLAGDKLLTGVGQRLSELFRESDFCVRWGGEEFLIVTRFASRDQTCVIAERIRNKIAEKTFDVGLKQAISVTCSIGIACYPFFTEAVSALKWEQVVDIADHALYAAKNSGRNAWVGVFSVPEAAAQPPFLSGEDWLRRWRSNLSVMAMQKLVKVRTSLPDASQLVWQSEGAPSHE